MRQKQNRSAWMCLWLYSSFLPAWAAFTLVAVGLCSCVCAKITFRFYHVFVHVEWKRASPVNVKVHAFIPFLNWVSKETLCVTGLLPTPTAPLKAACQVSFTIQSHECWRTCSFTSLRVSCRPAAGSRAGEDPSGEEQGAGAGAQADVLQQPGTTAGDRGKYLPSLTKYSPKQSSH